MGCTQSKIENEEAVKRCQERKQHMKHAIPARNAFASAHSAYAVALKKTGAALGDYAASEVQHPQFYPGGPSGAGASAAAAQLPIKEEEEKEENELENDESSNLRQRSSRGARDIRSGGGGGSGGSGSRKEVVAENEAPTQGATSPQRTQQEIDKCFYPPVENVTEPRLGEVAAEEVRVDKKHSAEKGKAGMTPDGKRVAKADISLAQIFFELDDHFQKASESVPEVSKMLEATGLHLHPNFADNRGLPNADDVKDDFDSEENETLATVLDELLLAWEKKLCDEVKEGELLNYERRKKVAAVDRRMNRGDHSESLEKMKAAARELYAKCLVNMHSVNSAFSEIERLRDEQLYPQLIQLVDGMAKMWKAMGICHESQYKTVKNLENLEIDQATKETSEHHHDPTLQLFKAVVDWHEQFKNVVDNQKNYIKDLKNWLASNVSPIKSSFGETVSPSRNDDPLIQKLVHTWEENLEKLPDEPARTAINKVREVFGAIVQDQEEEMKFKEKREKTNLELSRKSCSLSRLHREVMMPRTPSDDRHIAEKEGAVKMLKDRLAEEDAAYRARCLRVRQNTLKSFKNHLPELFECLSKFAIASSEMYGNLRSLSKPLRQNLSE